MSQDANDVWSGGCRFGIGFRVLGPLYLLVMVRFGVCIWCMDDYVAYSCVWSVANWRHSISECTTLMGHPNMSGKCLWSFANTLKWLHTLGVIRYDQGRAHHGVDHSNLLHEIWCRDGDSNMPVCTGFKIQLHSVPNRLYGTGNGNLPVMCEWTRPATRRRLLLCFLQYLNPTMQTRFVRATETNKENSGLTRLHWGTT